MIELKRYPIIDIATCTRQEFIDVMIVYGNSYRHAGWSTICTLFCELADTRGFGPITEVDLNPDVTFDIKFVKHNDNAPISLPAEKHNWNKRELRADDTKYLVLFRGAPPSNEVVTRVLKQRGHRKGYTWIDLDFVPLTAF